MAEEITDWQEIKPQINDWQDVAMPHSMAVDVLRSVGSGVINGVNQIPQAAGGLYNFIGQLAKEEANLAGLDTPSSRYNPANDSAQTVFSNVPTIYDIGRLAGAAALKPFHPGVSWGDIENSYKADKNTNPVGYAPQTGLGRFANDVAGMASQAAAFGAPVKAATAGSVGANLVKEIPENNMLGINPNSALLQLGGAMLGARAASPSVPETPYDTLKAHETIGQSYQSAKDSVAPAFDFMRQQAGNMTVDGSKLIEPLQGIIADIKSNPLHEAGPTLLPLQRTLEQLKQNPEIPLNDVVDLKQSVNSNFNPKRLTQDTRGPYFQFGDILDNQINQAAKTNPFFGQAKDIAYGQWLNTVEKPFQNNPVLQKFWKPDDYWNYKSVANGKLDEIPDETAQRAQLLVNNIKTPAQMNSVARALPGDAAYDFQNAVKNDITQKSGNTRLKSLVEAGKSALDVKPFSFLTNLADAAKGPKYTPAQLQLLEATKNAPPQLNIEPYVQRLNELQAKWGSLAPIGGGQ